MRRKLLLGMALVAAGALLFPVTAAPNGGDTLVDSEGTATNITLEPADGPNGKYAVVEGGDIALQFSPVENSDLEFGDGINAEGRHVFESVFVIDNAGDVTAENLYVTDDGDDVQFFRGDDPRDVIEGRDNNVTLPGGEEMHVGVVIDATGDPENINVFTVHAEGGGDGGEGGGEDDGNDGEAGEDGTILGSTGDEGSGDTGDEQTDDEETSDEQTDDEETSDEEIDEINVGTGDSDGVTDGDTGSVGDRTDGDGGTADQRGSVVRPYLPVPEVTLGGFILRTLLLLVAFVAAGTGTLAVTRRILERTEPGG